MDWIKKVTNKYPKGLFFIYIQEGKAKYRNDASGFIETDKVIGFMTLEEANYFIENYTPDCIDYKNCCMRGKTIYVFNENNRGGYYADNIRT